MEAPMPGGSGGDEGEDYNYWKQYEDVKKQKSYEASDKLPNFNTPPELFGIKNQNAVFIKPAPKLMPYGGKYKKKLSDLITDYDLPFKGGDQYLETSTLTVDQIKKTTIGKLAIARDTLMAFLFGLYCSEQEEWNYLRVTGFLKVMIRVAQGETCNNELSKELRKCLGL